MTASYRFRLEAVLRVRLLEERSAREVFGHATREVARRAAVARDARAACEGLPTVLEPMDALAFEAFRDHATRLADHASLAMQSLEESLEEHNLARAELVSARQRVSTLERLSARRYREWLDASERAETRAVDDVVSARSAASRMEEADV